MCERLKTLIIRTLRIVARPHVSPVLYQSLKLITFKAKKVLIIQTVSTWLAKGLLCFLTFLVTKSIFLYARAKECLYFKHMAMIGAS